MTEVWLQYCVLFGAAWFLVLRPALRGLYFAFSLIVYLSIWLLAPNLWRDMHDRKQ